MTEPICFIPAHENTTLLKKFTFTRPESGGFTVSFCAYANYVSNTACIIVYRIGETCALSMIPVGSRSFNWHDMEECPKLGYELRLYSEEPEPFEIISSTLIVIHNPVEVAEKREKFVEKVKDILQGIMDSCIDTQCVVTGIRDLSTDNRCKKCSGCRHKQLIVDVKELQNEMYKCATSHTEGSA